jgi:O-antigen ligase
VHATPANLDLVKFQYGAGIIGKAKYFLFESNPLIVLLAFAVLITIVVFVVTGRKLPLVFLLLVSLLLNGSVIMSLDAYGAIMRVVMVVFLAMTVMTARTAPGWPFLLFFIYFCNGLLWTINAPNIFYAIQWAGLCLCVQLSALSLAEYIKKPSDAAKICIMYILAAIVWTMVGAASLRELASGVGGGARFAGATNNAGLFSQTGGVMLPFVLWGALRPTWAKHWRILCGLLLIPMAVVLLASAQRTYTLAGIIGCMPLLFRVKLGRTLVVAVLVGAVGLLTVKLLTMNEKQAAFLAKRYFDDDLSNRDHIWSGTMEIIFKSPFIGQGFGSAKDILRLELSNSAHNQYLVAWIEAGILGLFFLILAILAAWWEAGMTVLRTRRSSPELHELSRLCLGLQGALAAAGFFSSGVSSASDISTTTVVFTMVILHRVSVMAREEQFADSRVPARGAGRNLAGTQPLRLPQGGMLPTGWRRRPMVQPG